MDITTGDHHTICGPISKLSDVWTYTQNPPQWVSNIIDLIPRSDLVIKNIPKNCHIEENQFAPSARLEHQSTPQTLVCHDMKGGYLEDKFTYAVNVGNGYTFYRWSQIDIFVYFSHHLVTIPPLFWINVAHSNGVKILGTLITEWNVGKQIWEEVFKDSSKLRKFVDELVDICTLFKLDGWLLNVENQLHDTEPLKQFVKLLTEVCHIRKPGSLIIWYDSIIENGQLKWQNELNDLNRCYFDLCDGIFLNYSWNEENLINTVSAAGHRFLDVYVGVDVFGRNFYGGGKFNTHLAAEKIRKYCLSMAIFGQGWTHETLEDEPSDTYLERFFLRDSTFWQSLWPYLYTHPINNYFETFFYVGVDKNWYKLDSQSKQLSRFLLPKEILLEAVDVPTLKDTCNCLQLHLNGNDTCCFITNVHLKTDYTHIHHLFSCDLNVSGNVVLYYYVNSTVSSGYLSLILLVRHKNGTHQKIICHSTFQEDLTSNISVLEVNASDEQSLLENVACNDVPKQWILRCYLLNFVDSKILEIGAKIDMENSVCLCGIGIKPIT